LTFVSGAFVAEFQLFPYPLIFRDAFAYIHAAQERTQTETIVKKEVATVPTKGRITIKATSDAFEGYTFLTYDTPRPSTARLIDMQGNVVHEWHRSLREIWPDTPQREKPSPETAISWRYAQLLPNGDIITTVKAMGDTPDGYGLVKLDKDSNVIWAVPENFNHHFSIASDGRIFGMIHQWRNTRERPVAGAASLPARVLEDFVMELSPDGKELSRASLLDAMAVPEFRDLLNSAAFRNFSTNAWDPLHPNDVEIIDADFASHHSFMKPGMLLISIRDLDALILFDPAARAVTWVMRGAWLRQHDPDLLGNGNIVLFDNRGYNASGNNSRVLEIDPASGRIVWSYAGTSKQPFNSEVGGGQQRLPNGNTLISEDDYGRIFEVDPKGTIVWEYRDVRLHHAMRVATDWLKFVPKAPGLAR
jgi:hypothetical protein